MNVHLPAPRRKWPARLLNLAVVIVMLALAAATFVLSYSGVHAIVAQAGVSARLSRLYPAIFDAVLVIACLAAVTLRDARWWARCYAWLVIILVVAAVGAADAVHAMNIALPHRTTEGVVAAAPWVLALLGFSLMLTMFRQSRAARPAAAAPPAGRPARRAAKRAGAEARPAGLSAAETEILPRAIAAAPRLEPTAAQPALPAETMAPMAEAMALPAEAMAPAVGGMAPAASAVAPATDFGTPTAELWSPAAEHDEDPPDDEGTPSGAATTAEASLAAWVLTPPAEAATLPEAAQAVAAMEWAAVQAPATDTAGEAGTAADASLAADLTAPRPGQAATAAGHAAAEADPTARFDTGGMRYDYWDADEENSRHVPGYQAATAADEDAPPYATAPFATIPRLNRVRATPTPPEEGDE